MASPGLGAWEPVLFAACGRHLRDVWEWVTSGGWWVPLGPSGFVEATAPVFPLHQLVGRTQEVVAVAVGGGAAARRTWLRGRALGQRGSACSRPRLTADGGAGQPGQAQAKPLPQSSLQSQRSENWPPACSTPSSLAPPAQTCELGDRPGSRGFPFPVPFWLRALEPSSTFLWPPHSLPSSTTLVSWHLYDCHVLLCPRAFAPAMFYLECISLDFECLFFFFSLTI